MDNESAVIQLKNRIKSRWFLLSFLELVSTYLNGTFFFFSFTILETPEDGQKFDIYITSISVLIGLDTLIFSEPNLNRVRERINCKPLYNRFRATTLFF